MLISLPLPLRAAPGVDGEVAAVWWSNELTTDTGAGATSSSAGAPGFRAELWMLERYGLRGSQFHSNADQIGDEGDASTSLDVMWRAFAPTKNNFLAMGLGWQRTDLGDLGLDAATSGVRLSLEGRLGFTNAIQGYAQGSYLPSLGDGQSTASGASYTDMKGLEYEVGVAFRLAPFVALHAGYRAQEVAFTESSLVGPGSGVSPTDTLSPAAASIGGKMGFRDTLPAPEACTGCAVSGSEVDGSSASKGFFVGLGIRF